MSVDVQSGIFAAMIEASKKADETKAPVVGGAPAPEKDKDAGAKKVARLNELLKYIQPPEKKKTAAK